MRILQRCYVQLLVERDEVDVVRIVDNIGRLVVVRTLNTHNLDLANCVIDMQNK